MVAANPIAKPAKPRSYRFTDAPLEVPIIYEAGPRDQNALGCEVSRRLGRMAPSAFWQNKSLPKWDQCPVRGCRDRYPAYYLTEILAETPATLTELRHEIQRLKAIARDKTSGKGRSGILARVAEARARMRRTRILCEECRSILAHRRRADFLDFEAEDVSNAIGPFERELFKQGLSNDTVALFVAFMEASNALDKADHHACLKELHILTGVELTPSTYAEDWQLLQQVRYALSACRIACDEAYEQEDSAFTVVTNELQLLGAKVASSRLLSDTTKALMKEIEYYKATGVVYADDGDWRTPRHLSPEYFNYMRTQEWRDRRDAVIGRANGKCERCGGREELQVHHLRYTHFGNEPLDDLECLCHECHSKCHSHMRRRGR